MSRLTDYKKKKNFSLTIVLIAPDKDTFLNESIIRIHHECEGGIKKSLLRVTVWQSDDKR